MNFKELEKICSLLWGQSWQSELARNLNIDRRTVSKWKTQGVAKWVNNELGEIIQKRKNEVFMAIDIHNFYSLVVDE